MFADQQSDLRTGRDFSESLLYVLRLIADMLLNSAE